MTDLTLTMTLGKNQINSTITFIQLLHSGLNLAIFSDQKKILFESTRHFFNTKIRN